MVGAATDGAGRALGQSLGQQPGLCVQKATLQRVPLGVGGILRLGGSAVALLRLFGGVGAALILGQAVGEGGERRLPLGQLLLLGSEEGILRLRVAEGGKLRLRPGQLLVQRVELGPRPAGLGLFKVGFALGGRLLGFELAAEGFRLFRLAEGLL